MTETIVRLSDLVAPVFIPFWKDGSYNKILKGGRSSTKSSNVSLRLVKEFLEDDLANTICFRKVAKYLSTSVYEQIKWAIYQLKVQDEFTFLKSPLKIIHNSSESAFYFFGVDDPQKIKSAKIAIGYVKDLWFEEASEFESKEELDMVTDTFIREELPNGKSVNTYLTYNPPRNSFNWLNEWVAELQSDPNYFIHHSTYKDVEKYLSKQFLQKIYDIQKTDPNYYEWMYGGKIVGLGDEIYNYKLFKQIDQLPDDDRLLFADIAIDTGYSTSATTFLFIGYTAKRKCILLDTYYYSPEFQLQKKAPSDFSKDLDLFHKRNTERWKVNVDTWVSDSADGAIRNQVNKDFGIYLQPAKKKQKVKMIENVEDLLAQDRVRVLVTKNNEIFLDEHRKYKWDLDTINRDDPKVIKEYDHTCDAFQYYVNNNLDKLGLRA
jgi:phage terminase large subunit